MPNLFKGLLLGLTLFIVSACGAIQSKSRAVFVLVDASGSYAKTMTDSMATSKLMVAKLNPNDSIAVAQISSCSFSDEGVVVNETLPGTPSRASFAKQAIFGALDTYGSNFQASNYTDIRGALRYASGELEMSGKSSRYIIVFSDLIEDVAANCDTSDLSLDLSGITVVATNVTKSAADSADPDRYDARLDAWETAVEEAGGTWQIAPSRDQLIEAVF